MLITKRLLIHQSSIIFKSADHLFCKDRVVSLKAHKLVLSAHLYILQFLMCKDMSLTNKINTKFMGIITFKHDKNILE